MKSPNFIGIILLFLICLSKHFCGFYVMIILNNPMERKNRNLPDQSLISIVPKENYDNNKININLYNYKIIINNIDLSTIQCTTD